MNAMQPFDPARHLDDEEVIQAYLDAALEDETPGAFLVALGNVAKARGMTEVAKAAGVGRASLYKTLAAGANPEFSTIEKVVRALGLKLVVAPAA